MTPYRTAAGYGEAEYEDKRSRFIGHIKPVTSENEAKAFIDEMRRKYADATHNVFAYVLREGNILRWSDDGEPGGTSGQPTLAVLQGAGLTDVCCVTTRYFGGILLGAGGLCRAYTKAAKDALDDAGISELRPWSVLRLDCPYALFERVKLEADKRGGLVRDADYGAQIALTILLPEPEEAEFRKALQELSAGSLCPERTGTELRGVRLR